MTDDPNIRAAAGEQLAIQAAYRDAERMRNRLQCIHYAYTLLPGKSADEVLRLAERIRAFAEDGASAGPGLRVVEG